MIQQLQTVSLVLKSPIYKLIQIQPSYQDTFVLLVIQEESFFESILHVNSQGALINKYPFDSSVEEITMISSHEALVCLFQQNCLAGIDILHHKRFTIKHQFAINAIDAIQLFSFYQSSLFCVKQYNMYSRRQLRLTYYHQQNKNAQIFFCQQQKQLENIMFIQKLNNHSQVGWYIRNYQKLREEIVIHDVVIHINGIKESRVRKICIADFTFLGFPYQNLLNIAKLWQIRQNQYLLLLTPQSIEKQPPEASNFLILDNTAKIIRLPHFNFPTKSFQFAISINYLYDFSFIQAKKIQYLKEDQDIKNYYFFHRTQKIFTKRQSEPKKEANYCVPSYDKNKILKVNFSSLKNSIQLEITKVYRILQIFLHFLLQINQDFDDDLLSDALQLLSQSIN